MDQACYETLLDTNHLRTYYLPCFQYYVGRVHGDFPKIKCKEYHPSLEYLLLLKCQKQVEKISITGKYAILL